MLDYILDTSYISESYKKCINFGRCKSHWGLLKSGCLHSPCYTIEHVIREILDWDNPPEDWVEREQDGVYFGGEMVYEIWGMPLCRFNARREREKVAAFVKSNYPKYKHAMDEFLREDKADAYIIAQAMKNRSIVVTMEKPKHGNGPPKIPDVCDQLGVKWMHPDAFLQTAHPSVVLCGCLY